MYDSKIWLITPPFTQINTPYPATCYLKGFLNTLGVQSYQSDLSLEVFLKIFSQDGLARIFREVAVKDPDLSENAFRIWSLQDRYQDTVDFVIHFLQSQKSTLAHKIISGEFLPRASRFDQLDISHDAFGDLGLIDRAKFMATLYLEDLGDFIQETVDPYFGFSRYAEKIAHSLSSFDEMQVALQSDDYITSIYSQEIINDCLPEIRPDIVAITIPFSGNLFSALKCAQYIKSKNSDIKILIGGGYCNTELRSLFEPRIFQYVDFITLDDGELPFKCILDYLTGHRKQTELKRTFILKDSVVFYCNNAIEKDIPQREVGTPDYRDLKLQHYLALLELANPMHRLWTDGRWNKLTMAHGCYWGKCTFCDVTLDYIDRYEPVSADILCDRIEEIIQQTGDYGFHFVDEAAPPALMRDLALQILKRKLQISWWANIRFEKAFTPDLCRLLARSGCIAVSGGLEVASDRLLKLIKKGVTIPQVSKVAQAFTQAGIMVHTYLMYGFPTQSDQETVDALDVVRQMFKEGIIQSGFWHLFTMTAHSPVGQNPENFGVSSVIEAPFGGFASNDLIHLDPVGADHEKYHEGLKLSLYNYMNGVGFEQKLNSWFLFKIPETTVPVNFIRKILNSSEVLKIPDHSKIIWVGGIPSSTQSQGKSVVVDLIRSNGESSLILNRKQYHWFIKLFSEYELSEFGVLTYGEFISFYQAEVSEDFEQFKESSLWQKLRKEGLLVV
ncbi:MAG: radical SAM protein [Saprospiraceae bacterium]|nr:radical SAM protein [Saprospiraceae bacterium]